MSKQNKSATIRAHILDSIQNGLWKTDDRIPSEKELCDQFSVSRMTVNRALKELANEGVLYRQRGLGTFVSRRVPRSDLLEIGDISEEITARGGQHSCTLISIGMEPPTPLTEHVFGIQAVGRIARSLAVHHENGVPIQLEDRWVDTAAAPGYLDLDFTSTTAHRFLSEHAPLCRAEHELTAVLPTEEKARLLDIRMDHPCLLLKRRTWGETALVSYAELLYPGSRYSFGGEFSPNSHQNHRTGR